MGVLKDILDAMESAGDTRHLQTRKKLKDLQDTSICILLQSNTSQIQLKRPYEKD